MFSPGAMCVWYPHTPFLSCRARPFSRDLFEIGLHDQAAAFQSLFFFGARNITTATLMDIFTERSSLYPR